MKSPFKDEKHFFRIRPPYILLVKGAFFTIFAQQKADTPKISLPIKNKHVIMQSIKDKKEIGHNNAATIILNTGIRYTDTLISLGSLYQKWDM